MLKCEAESKAIYPLNSIRTRFIVALWGTFGAKLSRFLRSANV